MVHTQKEFTLTQLRKDIAKHLGEGWSHTPNGESGYKDMQIRGPKGEVLFVTDKDKKLYISGTSKNYGELSSYLTAAAPMPDIGVSLSRGAELIAKEIKRRLLPDYYKAVELADKLSAERDQRSNATLEAVEGIEKALGAKYKRTQNKDSLSTSDPREVYMDAGGLNQYWKIRIPGPESIEFIIGSLDTKAAVKLAAFLTTL